MPVWRIRDRRTFLELRARGSRGRSGPVTVTALLTDGATPPRVAYAVGRSVGPAVVRNRVRRRLRAIAGELDLSSGAYLIAVGPAAASASYAELRGHVGRAVESTSR